MTTHREYSSIDSAVLPKGVSLLCKAFRDGLVDVLGAKLFGLVLTGAIVFPETGGTGDLDFHVVLNTEPSDAEIATVRGLHQDLEQRFPPHGAELDAYYILLEEARRPAPPTHQLDRSMVDSSWALHRSHMLAGRCIVWYGPQPEDVFPPPTWDELERALDGEFDYVVRHTHIYPGYCVLNLCRLMFSSITRDVVTSKFASAAWATTEYPQWKDLIELARQSYIHQLSDSARATLLANVEEFLEFARGEIGSRRSNNV
jgi:hypothetical protein